MTCWPWRPNLVYLKSDYVLTQKEMNMWTFSKKWIYTIKLGSRRDSFQAIEELLYYLTMSLLPAYDSPQPPAVYVNASFWLKRVEGRVEGFVLVQGLRGSQAQFWVLLLLDPWWRIKAKWEHILEQSDSPCGRQDTGSQRRSQKHTTPKGDPQQRTCSSNKTLSSQVCRTPFQQCSAQGWSFSTGSLRDHNV